MSFMVNVGKYTIHWVFGLCSLDSWKVNGMWMEETWFGKAEWICAFSDKHLAAVWYFPRKHRSWLANVRTSMICLQIYNISSTISTGSKAGLFSLKNLATGKLGINMDLGSSDQKFGRPRASRRGSWCEQSFQNLHLALDSLTGPRG